jgi:hypothetical protein
MIVGATAIAAHAAPAVALEKPADLADVTAAQPGSFFSHGRLQREWRTARDRSLFSCR